MRFFLSRPCNDLAELLTGVAPWTSFSVVVPIRSFPGPPVPVPHGTAEDAPFLLPLSHPVRDDLGVLVSHGPEETVLCVPPQGALAFSVTLQVLCCGSPCPRGKPSLCRCVSGWESCVISSFRLRLHLSPSGVIALPEIRSFLK